MKTTMYQIMHPGSGGELIGFPDAPDGWSPDDQPTLEGAEISEAHWEVVRALQHLFSRNEGRFLNRRALQDALEEHFHLQGGVRYLYQLFPLGPVSQGCRLAGLEPPPGSSSASFGSVL